MGLAVILQRGRCAEEVNTPGDCPFYRCYNEPSTNRLGVDAERNYAGVHREKSKRKSDRPGESFSAIAPDR